MARLGRRVEGGGRQTDRQTRSRLDGTKTTVEIPECVGAALGPSAPPERSLSHGDGSHILLDARPARMAPRAGAHRRETRHSALLCDIRDLGGVRPPQHTEREDRATGGGLVPSGSGSGQPRGRVCPSLMPTGGARTRFPQKGVSSTQQVQSKGLLSPGEGVGLPAANRRRAENGFRDSFGPGDETHALVGEFRWSLVAFTLLPRGMPSSGPRIQT